MAEILPFIGTRYNSQLIGDLSKVIAPPYDVITPEMQEALYERHPNNIVRVELTKNEEDDSFADKYARAANYLRTWRSDGVLIEDNQPSIYLYEQEFALPTGEVKKRRGFYALVKLEDYASGGIKAHEHTFAGPKADRLKLLRATRTNVSPIFVIYNDPDGATAALLNERFDNSKPWEEVVDDDGVTHRLWVVSKKEFILQLRELMKSRNLFIADGHHRYETALAYRNEMRQETGKCDGKQPFDYMMMYLTHAEQDGLVILPTHRVLTKAIMAEVDLKEALDELKESFEITEDRVNLKKSAEEGKRLTEKVEKLGKTRPSFGMVDASGKVRYLRLKKNVDPADLIESDDVPAPVRKLDVVLLHNYVINRVMIGNPEFELADDECLYVRDAKRVLDLLAEKKGLLAFIMNATPMEQVLEIVSAGYKMPHKSTYFHPKLASGLVLRNMEIEFQKKKRTSC